MKLYARKNKSDMQTKQVLVAAKFVGVDLEVKYTTRADEVVKQSPFATLPILEADSGVYIPRSSAILRYMAGLRTDSSLYGITLFEEAQVDQWLDFRKHELEVPIVALTAPPSKFSEDIVRKGIAAAQSKLVSLLKILENHLSTRTFMVGQRVSLADIALVCALEPVFASVIDKSTRESTIPHTFRWFMTCIHQPAFKAVLGPVRLCGDAPAPAPAAGAGAGARAGGARAGAGGGAGGAAGGAAPSAVGGSMSVLVDSAPGELFSRRRHRVRQVLHSGETLVGDTITVSGWVRTCRAQASLCFIAVTDGSGFGDLQLVVDKEKADPEGFAAASKAGTGASITATGVVVKSPKAGQAVELSVESFRVIGQADGTSYPLAKKRHTLEHLRSLLHLRMRTNAIGAAVRVRDACAYATHKFFHERGFLYIHTPIITASDCEGAGEMFQVTTLLPEDPKGHLKRTRDGAIDYSKDFFKQPTSLTVSGQLQVECFSVSMSDVYTFGPTFRAEESHTSRHLAEFWMIEPEICFADIFDDMDLAEDYIKFVVRYVMDRCAEDLAFFNDRIDKELLSRLTNLLEEPFARITYTEAIDILLEPKNLKKGKFQVKPYWGLDLGSEHERFLTEVVYKKPVFVRDYPKEFKAFYMKLNPDKKTVAAMDLLVPGVGELIGGSQREDNLEVLEARMAEAGVDGSGLEWYKDLRRFGSAPHAGFGAGFERLVMYTTGIQNIRDVIPFPRYPGHASD